MAAIGYRQAAEFLALPAPTAVSAAGTAAVREARGRSR